ncbi:hypothetical protein MKX01_042392 [Papaver californicum]|nr:hypothetical protein MKX01_042392 [Papaver californicum]
MAHDITESDEFVDWKGRELQEAKHKGIKSAAIVCVVEVLENLVFLSNATNFVSYFRSSMHYSSAEAANMVTNFIGTSFLLTVVGGFISDSFFTRFKTFLLSGSIELLGLIMLTIQANNAQLRPTTGKSPSQWQAAFLYVGLYAIAIGIGGIKSSLPAHGADQFAHSNKRLISSYFNWFFFSLCTGGLLSCTIMVWIEENKGWQWSFSISVAVLSLAILLFSSGYPIYRYRLPSGSPITRIFKVFFYAARNRKAQQPAVMNNQNELDNGSSYAKFRFLNKALTDDSISLNQLQETKTFLGLLPIFSSTIMMNCCLAQLQTFSVHQGVIMNRKITRGFEIPPPSLSVFPLVFMLLSIPVYEHLVLKLVKKKNSSTSPQETSIFPPLKRIGLGLALASASMAVAAIVEVKRRNYSVNDDVKLSIFWLGFQFLLLGVSDMCTLGGMLEFFYSEAPESMRSMCTALAWCSTSMGYFISSILVSITNSVSRHAGNEWLGGSNLDENRLDLFYTVLCVLNFLNLLNYMYWAKRY